MSVIDFNGLSLCNLIIYCFVNHGSIDIFIVVEVIVEIMVQIKLKSKLVNKQS